MLNDDRCEGMRALRSLGVPDESVLTLITCYPFYYVGYAPDRYIVRGVLETRSPRQPAESSRGEPSVARGAGPRQESTGSLAIDEGDD